MGTAHRNSPSLMTQAVSPSGTTLLFLVNLAADHLAVMAPIGALSDVLAFPWMAPNCQIGTTTFAVSLSTVTISPGWNQPGAFTCRRHTPAGRSSIARPGTESATVCGCCLGS